MGYDPRNCNRFLWEYLCCRRNIFTGFARAGSANRQSGDAFVVKIDTSGSQVRFTVILGGSGYDSARGDQCDNCQNQLDPIDLINPRSKINGETPIFVETEQFFLDLPAFADVLGTWLQSKSGQWQPNVLKFSLNLLGDLQPRAITRDLDWGVPIPLEGWLDRADKRIYVWFDAVIGYLSASIEWARR